MNYTFLNDVLSDYTLYGLFTVVVASSTFRSLKPNPQIYQTALQRLALKSDEVLFVDDTERNIVGALSLGIQSILFKSAGQLEQDLKELGLV